MKERAGWVRTMMELNSLPAIGTEIAVTSNTITVGTMSAIATPLAAATIMGTMTTGTIIAITS